MRGRLSVEPERNRFIDALAGVCEKDHLAEKWLICPSLRVGWQWLETVTLAGQAVLNLHLKTFKSVALDLAAPAMARQGLRLVSDLSGSLIMEEVRAQLSTKKRSAYLLSLKPGLGLIRAFYQSIKALRMAGLGGILPSGSFEVAGKGEELGYLLSGFERALAERKLVDYPEVLALAAKRLKAEPSALPEGLQLLLPGDMEWSSREKIMLRMLGNRTTELPFDGFYDEEETLPGDSDRDLLRWLPAPDQAPEPREDGTAGLFHAVGEVNEVREVLRRCQAGGYALDQVELLHTQADTFIPLIFEIADKQFIAEEGGQELPITFAEGIPLRFTRPGRAFAAWLAWIQQGYQQTALSKMLDAGLLNDPRTRSKNTNFDHSDPPTWFDLQTRFKTIRIGFGRDRYPKKINEEIFRLERTLASQKATPAEEKELKKQLACTRELEQLVTQLLDTTPEKNAAPGTLLANARQFIETVASSSNEYDNLANHALVRALNEASDLLEKEVGISPTPLWEWLELLPTELRVGGSGPRPGCLHVANLFSGGHSGRSHTFIVGLDDSRFPGVILQDPILLDDERRKLSRAPETELPTAAGELGKRLRQFYRLLAGLRGNVTLSFSSKSLEDNREIFPSPSLVSAFRILSGIRDGDQQRFFNWLARPASFTPREAGECLDRTAWWRWRLTATPRVKNAEPAVRRAFPLLQQGWVAQEQRALPEFSVFDGWVGQADPELSPFELAGPKLSASTLETLGRCPRAYFYQKILGLEEPDEQVIDPARWLDPRAMGSLLHEVFHHFYLALIEEDQLPARFDRDWPRLEAIVKNRIERFKNDYPPPGESPFKRQCREIQKAALIFLREEEAFCAGSLPRYLELDLDQEITLPGKRTIRVRGRVDRVDQIPPAEDQLYSVWDYKTGGRYKFDPADPFRQGRTLQHTLYLDMVTGHLRDQHSPDARVKETGYFFPSARAHGERLSWTAEEQKTGKTIIAGLCRIAAGGAYPATDELADCTYCAYQAVCGNAAEVVEQGLTKCARDDSNLLVPFREVRGHD